MILLMILACFSYVAVITVAFFLFANIENNLRFLCYKFYFFFINYGDFNFLKISKRNLRKKI